MVLSGTRKLSCRVRQEMVSALGAARCMVTFGATQFIEVSTERSVSVATVGSRGA